MTMEYGVAYPGMTWAVYREIEVHLAQILAERPQILLRTDPVYDYNLDQVDRLLFMLPADDAARALVYDVLLHYVERWRMIATKVGSVTVYKGTQELRLEETDRNSCLEFLSASSL
jgi:hypothetical protein